MTPAVRDGLHDEVEGRLRASGQRYTSQRRSLVEALRRLERPAAAQDLATRRIPQSSTYRNLAVLEHAGVVRRVMTEDGVGRFELAEDLTEHHHHLVCRVCGAVEDVTVPARLERSVERALADAASGAGFEGVSHRFDLVGTCRNCR